MGLSPLFFPTSLPPCHGATELLLTGPGMAFSLDFFITFREFLAELLLVVLYFGYDSHFEEYLARGKLSF